MVFKGDHYSPIYGKGHPDGYLFLVTFLMWNERLLSRLAQRTRFCVSWILQNSGRSELAARLRRLASQYHQGAHESPRSHLYQVLASFRARVGPASILTTCLLPCSVSWQQHSLAAYLNNHYDDFIRHIKEINDLLQSNYQVLTFVTSPNRRSDSSTVFRSDSRTSLRRDPWLDCH